MDTSKVIGLEGGQDSTWFRVLHEVGRDKTKYYPAVVDGVEASWSDFSSLDDYLAHKVERERETIRFAVAGNAVVAEEAIARTLNCKALAINPTTVDAYPEQPVIDSGEAAAQLGRLTSDKKAAAVRANGQRGGRPAKRIVSQLLFANNGTEATIHFEDGSTEARQADAEDHLDLSDLWFVDAVTGKRVRWGEDGLYEIDGGWTRL